MEEKKSKRKEYAQNFYIRNKELILRKSQAYYWKNRQVILEKARLKYQAKKNQAKKNDSTGEN